MDNVKTMKKGSDKLRVIGLNALALFAIPFYALALFVILILRLCVRTFLSYTQPGFVGLLNIYDLFFDREPPATLSIINILAMLRLTHLKSETELRSEIIKIVKRILLDSKSIKLRCVIKEWLGFRYWQTADVDVDKQIRMFEAKTQQEINEFLNKVSNEPIYDGRMWELYIGKNSIDGQFPVIFKVHHSTADGYGIRNLLVDSQSIHTEQDENVKTGESAVENMMKEIRNLLPSSYSSLIMLLGAPIWCVRQYGSPMDENSLRAETLSSRKQISWKKASFDKIKEIQKHTGNAFTEIILTAVSKSLDDLFKTRDETVPQITLVYPHRKSSDSSGLENEFILAPVKLPVAITGQTTSRAIDVAAACRRLKDIPNYKLNYFAPRFACLLFPTSLPKWAYKCTEFTALVSNFPGPANKLKFDGFDCESAVFLVPNIVDNNALGITMVSYNGHYTIACILDEAVSKNKDDSEKIAWGIVKYIDDTHESLQSTKK